MGAVKSRITIFSGRISRLKEELMPANPVIAPYVPAGEKRKSARFLDMQRGDGQIITQC